MVHRKQGSQEWRSWTKNEWKHYFKRQGITSPLPQLTGTIFERAHKAARFLTRQGFRTFSGIDLAALAHLDTWSSETSHGHLSNLYKALAENYEEERPTEIPAIQLLRMEVGAYRGNLHTFRGYIMSPAGGLLPIPLEAHTDKIHGLQVSPGDWQSGIRLPEYHTPDTARLMGYYWGAGTLSQATHHSGLLSISVRREKEKILEERVAPLIQKVHAVTPHRVTRTKKEKTYLKTKVKSDCLRISSPALVTYLHYGLGMPLSKRERGTLGRTPKPFLPKLPWNNDMFNAFVLGLLEVRGRIPPTGRIAIQGTGAYGEELVDMLKIYGHSGSGPYVRGNGEAWYIACTHETSAFFRKRVYAP